MKNFTLAFGLMLIACVVAAPAFAVDAQSFSEPANWSVGDSGSSYNEWDVLLSPGAGLAPDVGSNYGSSTLSTVYPGYVSGSSNFYSHASAYSASAAIESPSVAGSSGTHVIVQTAATLGMMGAGITSLEIDVLGTTFSPFASTSQTFTISSSYGPVSQRETHYSFMLPGGTDNFLLSWTNPQHSSFKALRVDTNAVPEPSSIAMLGIAALGLGLVARRRRNG
jgi:hypothetical protein